VLYLKEDGELLTGARAAEYIGLHRQTRFQRATGGNIPPVFTIDDRMRVIYKPTLDQ
jgi:hypothetical protein